MLKNFKLLQSSITGSTYIQTLAILDVSWTSFLTIWLPLATISGMLNEHCFMLKSVFI